jgi:hypothetical protein
LEGCPVALCYSVPRTLQALNPNLLTQKSEHSRSLALENEVFADELRQLLYGQGRRAFRILFTIRNEVVFILFVRHTAQDLLKPEDFEEM